MDASSSSSSTATTTTVAVELTAAAPLMTVAVDQNKHDDKIIFLHNNNIKFNTLK